MSAARFWTCRVCRERHPRSTQKCACGQRRPARKTQTQKALVEPYEIWVDGYGEACGICGAVPKEGRKLHRDHDHATGLPRGLLCFRCNAALRSYMTADWLGKALAYLLR